MEFELLQEYESKNIEKAVKILRGYKKDKLDISEFYPEFKLNNPYTATNSTPMNSIKPYQLLPFFKTVIVDVLPLESENLFETYYGMSVSELIELKSKGRAVIRLPYPYTKYKDIDNDYLDPIIEQKPPSATARDLNYSLLTNAKFLEEIDGRDKFFNEKKFDFGNNVALENGMIDPLTIASFDIISGNTGALLKFDDEVYVNILKFNCQKLSLLGYKDINKTLKKILELGYGRLDWAFAYSVAYTSFLTDPVFNSLDGTHLVNNNIKEVLNDLFIRAENNNLFKELLEGNGKYDLGKIFTEEIITAIPINFEQSLDFAYGGAIKALKSLERAVDNRNVDNITDRIHDLKTEINEADKTVESMKDQLTTTKGYMRKIGISIGILGSAANLFAADPSVKHLMDVISLIYGAIEGLNEVKVLDPVLESVLKLKKEDHVLYLYNNYGKYDIDDYNLDKRILKCNRVFKDNLTRKYEYYEKLYREIPILRVLIDFETRNLIGKGPRLAYEGKIRNAKIIKKIQEWFNKNYPVEFWRIMHKHLLLYGQAFMVKNNKSSYCIVNPKCIRPIHNNYRILDKRGKEKILPKDRVLSLDPSLISLIEYYIPLFDMVYPKITLKGNRPKLLYDLFFEKLQIAENLIFTDFEIPKKILEEILPISIKLKNVMYSTIVLKELADLHKKNQSYEGALEYYIKAEECLKNRVYSNIMEKLELEIEKGIVETLNFI